MRGTIKKSAEVFAKDDDLQTRQTWRSASDHDVMSSTSNLTVFGYLIAEQTI